MFMPSILHLPFLLGFLSAKVGESHEVGNPYSYITREVLLLALSGHSGFDPTAKAGDLLLGPFPIAGHCALCQPLKNVLGMSADVVVIPEVEGEIHGFPVAFTEQGPDVSCKAGRTVPSGHNRAPFEAVYNAARETIAQMAGR